MDILEKIKPYLENHFIYEGEITLDTRFIEDLGADSLDINELANDLEGEFGIEILTQDLADLQTLGDIVRYIEERI